VLLVVLPFVAYVTGDFYLVLALQGQLLTAEDTPSDFLGCTDKLVLLGCRSFLRRLVCIAHGARL
jgi:hypothetical protein